MSPTLGEKLRQARESRGLSIGNVSEQTRIAPHYLAAIESDDYGVLPGGIFNKGFIRSFAKCVGIDDAEALADYASQSGTASGMSVDSADELYSPAVYSDSKIADGRLQTVVLAAVVFLIVAGGLGATAYYVFQDDGTATTETRKEELSAPTQPAPLVTPSPTPSGFEAGFSVEIGASGELVQFLSDVDGVKEQRSLEPGSTTTIEVESGVSLSFYRTFVPLVTLKINGKTVALPKPRGSTLKVVIDKDNVEGIFEKGEYPSSTAEEKSPLEPSAPAAKVAASNSGGASGTGAQPGTSANRPRANANRPFATRPAANRPAANRLRVAPNSASTRPN